MEIIKYTVVIIDSTPNAFLVKCAYCNGTGTTGWSNTCRVCKGIGKVWLEVPTDWKCKDVGIIKCVYCNGTGTTGWSNTCRVCHGVGALVKCFPRVKCAYCNGSGTTGWSNICRVCGGCGSVWAEKVIKY